MNCVFCEKELEKSIFAETDNFLAIYNIAPILPGHSLIIPKRHVISLMNLNNEELIEMMSFAKKITSQLMQTFKSDGFNWSIQDGVSAGQTINHLHLHIIVRHKGDLKNPGDWYFKLEDIKRNVLDTFTREILTDSEVNSIVKKLKETIKLN